MTLDFYEQKAAELARRYDAIQLDEPLSSFVRAVGHPAAVLEIGCGSGRDAARLLATGVDVRVIDGSAAMIREAIALHPQLNGRVTRLVLPAALPFADASYDGVYSAATLMHLLIDALPGTFDEIARVVRPGGVLSYSVNTARSGLDDTGADEFGRHFTCLSGDAWEELHLAAGFRTVSRRESDDGLDRRGIRWISFVARRTGGPDE